MPVYSESCQSTESFQFSESIMMLFLAEGFREIIDGI